MSENHLFKNRMATYLPDTNNDHDTSDRSGCHRKRTAGEIPMIELTIQISSSM